MAENTFQAVQEYRVATDIDVEQLQANLTTQQAFIPRNPNWVSRYPLGDVTFPEFMLMYWGMQGVTATASAGTGHTHGPGTLQVGPTGLSVNQNNSVGSYVTISHAITIDTIAMFVYKTAATVMNNVYLEAFREKSSDSSLTRVAVSADIATQLLNGVLTFIAKPITPFTAQPGERYLVRVRNSSTVNVQGATLGLAIGSSSATNAFGTTNATDTAKTSYTGAEALSAQGASTSIVFGALAATGMAVTDESYSDDFNRSTMGGLWTRDSLAVISSGRVTYGTSGSAGRAWATYVRNTVSDNQRVEARFYNTANLATAGQGIYLNSTADRLNCVALWVQDAIAGGTAKIYSFSGGSGTSRASISLAGFGQGEATWSLYYESTPNRYTVLRNGLATGLTWTDSGNVVSHGALYRYGGLFVEQDLLVLVPVKGGQVDNWNLRDYVP